jgi:aspartate/methionine/tyrosine aminotransferase
VTSPSDPNNRWEPDLEDLRKKISKRTKYIIIDHPTNPCAIVYKDKTLKRIIDIAGEHDLPLIVDEMYQLIAYDGLKVKSVVSLAKDVPMIMVQSTSKFWMMPGWSLGYACFHDPEGKMAEIEEAVMKHASYQGFASTRIPTPIMVAAARTFVDPKAIDLGFKMVKTVERRRDFTYKRLNEIEGISMKVKPEVTLYGLFRVDEIGQKNSRWAGDKEFSLEVLRKEGLIFSTGSFFGPSAFGHCRTLLYRSIQTLTEGYDRLERFMKTQK